jgi:hypothetical protein
MSDQDVRSLPVGERAELLALVRRQLEILPNPSHAGELAIAMVELLESEPAVDVQNAG